MPRSRRLSRLRLELHYDRSTVRVANAECLDEAIQVMRQFRVSELPPKFVHIYRVMTLFGMVSSGLPFPPPFVVTRAELTDARQFDLMVERLSAVLPDASPRREMTEERRAAMSRRSRAVHARLKLSPVEGPPLNRLMAITPYDTVIQEISPLVFRVTYHSFDWIVKPHGDIKWSILPVGHDYSTEPVVFSPRLAREYLTSGKIPT